jgi:Zn-finger nucleic acid-binding protein
MADDSTARHHVLNQPMRRLGPGHQQSCRPGQLSDDNQVSKEMTMNCPVDQTELRMTDRQGVEIDYCPQCRGVWLDRGELDKLIERGAAMSAAPPPPVAGTGFGERRAYEREDEYRPRSPYRRDDDDDDDYREGYRGQRRRGWLGDIFDFG